MPPPSRQMRRFSVQGIIESLEGVEERIVNSSELDRLSAVIEFAIRLDRGISTADALRAVIEISSFRFRGAALWNTGIFQ